MFKFICAKHGRVIEPGARRTAAAEGAQREKELIRSRWDHRYVVFAGYCAQDIVPGRLDGQTRTRVVAGRGRDIAPC